MTPFKVLFFDIETAPLLAHVWHPFGDFVGQDQLLADSFMLTWAAKWEGETQVISQRLTKEEALAQDDTRIIQGLADMVRSADIVVAHNGDKFDIPILNKRVFLLGLEPLGPYRSIDTLKLAKQSFRMEMNKLDFLAERLGLGRKIKTDFMLWREAYQGSVAALKEMETYNRQDVILLEQVFDRMKPYVRYLSRLYDGPGMICPTCGSDHLQKRGLYRTQVSTYQQWQCQNCKRYCRTKSLAEKRLPVHPL